MTLPSPCSNGQGQVNFLSTCCHFIGRFPSFPSSVPLTCADCATIWLLGGKSNVFFFHVGEEEIARDFQGKKAIN